jgi:hypothetical protein
MSGAWRAKNSRTVSRLMPGSFLDMDDQSVK